MKKINVIIALIIVFTTIITLSVIISIKGNNFGNNKEIEITHILLNNTLPSSNNWPEVIYDPPIIRWYIGLGNKENEEYLGTYLELMDRINKSTTEIQLIAEVVPNTEALRVINNEIRIGNPPDVIGPNTINEYAEINSFWTDLTPFMKDQPLDQDEYERAVIDIYVNNDDELLSLPYIVFPSVTYYNKELFLSQNITFPPHMFSQTYSLLGEPEKEWNISTFSYLAMMLTLDGNGRNALDTNFNSSQIVQFGYLPQWENIDDLAKMFDTAIRVNENREKGEYDVIIPKEWSDAIKWYYDAIWKYHFIPNKQQIQKMGIELNQLFNNGKIAMVQTDSWYTKLNIEEIDWDIAVLPSYEEKITVPGHEVAFRIIGTTKQPKASFLLLQYFNNPRFATQLLPILGGIPAQRSLRNEYIIELNNNSVMKKNWQVASDSIAYLFTSEMKNGIPKFQEYTLRLNEFQNLLMSEPNITIEKEIIQLHDDLYTLLNGM